MTSVATSMGRQCVCAILSLPLHCPCDGTVPFSVVVAPADVRRIFAAAASDAPDVDAAA